MHFKIEKFHALGCFDRAPTPLNRAAQAGDPLPLSSVLTSTSKSGRPLQAKRRSGLRKQPSRPFHLQSKFRAFAIGRALHGRGAKRSALGSSAAVQLGQRIRSWRSRCLIPGSHDDAGVKRGVRAASCSSNWSRNPELGRLRDTARSIEPGQTHIRSPLEDGCTNFPLAAAGAQKARPVFDTAFQPAGISVRLLDPPRLIRPRGMSVSVWSRQTAFVTAPSMTTPAVTYFHSATSNFLARATMVVFLRRP